MSLFKLKNNKVINQDNRCTLDVKHNNMLSKLPENILRVKGCTKLDEDKHYSYFERVPSGRVSVTALLSPMFSTSMPVTVMPFVKSSTPPPVISNVSCPKPPLITSLASWVWVPVIRIMSLPPPELML